MKLKDINKKSVQSISNQELLGLHRRLHMLYMGYIKRENKNSEYVHNLVKIHNILANEMLRRKMKHNSPLTIVTDPVVNDGASN